MSSNRSLQSQQLAEATGRRHDANAIQGSQSWLQMPQMLVGNFQQARAQERQYQQAVEGFEMEKAMHESQLGLSELRRQQAFEELQWARELHNTDMMALQKELTRAQTQYEIARLHEEAKTLGKGYFEADPADLDPYMEAMAAASGWKRTGIVGNRVIVEEITDPEELRAAKQNYDRMRQQRMLEQSMLRGYGGRGGPSITDARVTTQSRADRVVDQIEFLQGQKMQLEGRLSIEEGAAAEAVREQMKAIDKQIEGLQKELEYYDSQLSDIVGVPSYGQMQPQQQGGADLSPQAIEALEKAAESIANRLRQQGQR